MELAIASAYPYILWTEIPELASKAKLLDDRVKIANLDLTFVAANTAPQKGQIKNGLNRGEFFEYMVRVAHVKFVQNKQVSKVHEAFQLLVDQHLKPNLYVQNWQNFRDGELWTIDVNDVFEANL